MRNALFGIVSLTLAALVCATVAAQGSVTVENATIPGALRHYATLHSIGLEWDITGDRNHNATCTVRYRRKGAAEWKQAMPLFRVDYAWYYANNKAQKPANMLAGSIMFLMPGVEYEVKLELEDPDGGRDAREISIRTRPIPEAPKDSRILHAVPGNGGGAGTLKDPFKGIATAEAAARPGDTVLLHKGDYGQVTLAKSGEANGKYIIWKAAGEGEALFGKITLTGSFIWLDGLTLRCPSEKEKISGIVATGRVVGTVITRCDIRGYHYCIRMSRESQDWYIADNVMVGDKPLPQRGAKVPDPTSGEGVEMAESVGGHVICYNSISRVADGVSYPGHDCDVYGNDIFDFSDDAIEFDRGWANNRCWGNRIFNFGAAALSFQPMYSGPWYFIRNQIVSNIFEDTELRKPHIFKFRVQDRFVLVNNTIVFPSFLDVYSDSFFTSFCRNNLFISSTGSKPIWVAFRYQKKSEREPDPLLYVLPLQKPGWMTDVDYDGYDWGDDPGRKESAFRYDWDQGQQNFLDLESFSRATGVEKHGLRVRKEEIFESWPVPKEPGRVEQMVLTLKKGGRAVDAGSALPNLAEDFTGKAPDLGAHEFGKPLPHYGVRDEKAMKDHALYWALFGK